LCSNDSLSNESSLWRFSGFGEVKRLTLACAGAGVLAALVVMGLGLRAVPRAVLALHPVVTLMGVCVVRIAYRMVYEHGRSRISGGAADARRAIVMGAGAAARMLLAGIHEQGWTVLGLLDDDPAKRRTRIGPVPVLGPLDAIRDKAVRGAATHVIVAMPSATPDERRRALDLAATTGLPVLTVPTVDELREGRSRIERLRDIEAEDLLGRAPVQLDEAGIEKQLSDFANCAALARQAGYDGVEIIGSAGYLLSTFLVQKTAGAAPGRTGCASRWRSCAGCARRWGPISS
jgi:FlaA1/EpsC-like NDP-sugar epimerase